MKIYEIESGSNEGDITWDSIGGLKDVKEELQLVIKYQFRQGFSLFLKRFDLKPVKGILLYGPPGCGKTMFARMLAKDAGVSFFSVKGSDFRSKWYGETERNLQGIFEKGRQNAPAIILFDEIDSVLLTRGEITDGDSPEKGIIAIFLSEMDGVDSMRKVIIVGTTNQPDSIDPAALRPGRFDKMIYVPLPDTRGREKIFRIHLKQKPLAEEIDFGQLAEITERFSGADIADVCSKVAEQAMRESIREGRTLKISMAALETQIKTTKPSVTLESLRKFEELREKYNRRTIKEETGPAEKKQTYTWEQIGGLDHVKQQLIEAIETPLREADLYKKYEIVPPKGVLLYGPPGCGKTLMAKIIANQCGAHFLSVDVRKEKAESICEWFVRARENKPSILFFDEIDAIATARGMGGTISQDVVAQLLIELDGMEELKQVVVVAATNRPDQIDSALMRPGRFDRLIYIPPPDEKSRLQILRIHLRGKPLDKDVNLSMLAEKTKNYSGADLSALCYEASMNLIRRAKKGYTEISVADFSSALKKVKSSITQEDIAYFDEIAKMYVRG
jgi:transitional endoplasmic reticulum ATPase